MKRSLLLISLTTAILALGLAACTGAGPDANQGSVLSTETELAVAGASPEQIQLAQVSLQRKLLAQRVELAQRTPLTLRLSQQDLLERALAEREQRDVFPGPKLVGVVEPVSQVVDLTGLAPQLGQSLSLPLGAVRQRIDGRIYSAQIRSEGAEALRLELAELDLPEGAELYVYNESGEAYGPYTGRGPSGDGSLWTPSLAGDSVTVQVNQPGAARFQIVGVGHLAPAALDLDGPQADERYNIGTACYGASCTKNASCYNLSSLAGAQDGVAHYQFIQNPYIYMCSGGLLADSEPASQIPYFLTANHCVSRQRVADTIEAFFRYTRTCSATCGNAETDGIKVAGGATLLKTSSTSDYSLLRLNNPPPSGSVFIGWDATPIAYSNGAALKRVSHPAGGPQAYSEHVVDTSKGTCSSWPRGNWIYSRDTLGATEGGSSGSVVLNAQAKVVGQLSGGCGTNVYDECDSVSNATVDGALAAYYADVAQWLGGGSSGCSDDADLDGYISEACGGDDCNDNNDSIHPGAAEACDSVDNDCDGTVDEGCPPPSCLGSGEVCTTNSQCCSNSCKGKKVKYCR
jgi:hypothetical protein